MSMLASLQSLFRYQAWAHDGAERALALAFTDAHEARQLLGRAACGLGAQRAQALHRCDTPPDIACWPRL